MTSMQALAPLIEAVLLNDAICVVGSEPAVNKEKELFDRRPSTDQWLNKREFTGAVK